MNKRLLSNNLEMSSDEKKIEISNPFLHDEKFKTTIEDLVSLINAAVSLNPSEMIEKLEIMGGEQFFERALNTNFEKGILCSQNNDLKEREKLFGHNRKSLETQKTSFWQIFCLPFYNLPTTVLTICVILSIIVKSLVKGKNDRTDDFVLLFWVLALIIFQIVFNFILNQQEKKNSFDYSCMNYVKVIRESKIIDLEEKNILTGDIIMISPGLAIPCDGLLIKGQDIIVEESSINGEAGEIKKKTFQECLQEKKKFISGANEITVPSPFLFSGTHVVDGNGLLLCLVVGANSYAGKIKKLIEEKKIESPIQQKAIQSASFFGKFCILTSLIIFITMVIYFISQRVSENDFNKEEDYIEIIWIFIYIVCYANATIPDNLKVCIIAVLAKVVKSLLLSNNLVRKLEACENLARIDVICTEKTGILTNNDYSFRQFWNQKKIDIIPYSHEPFDNFFPNPIIKNLFIQNAVINSSVDLDWLRGNKLEVSLIKFLQHSDIDCRKINEEAKILQTFHFSAKRKCRSCIIALPNSNKSRILLKGNAKILLNDCTTIHDLNDKVVEITPNLKEKIFTQIEEMELQALNTILFAYKDFDSLEDVNEKFDSDVYKIEKNNFTLIGILGFNDCLKMNTPSAIDTLKKAGIKVIMTTGDSLLTSKVISQVIGISNGNDDQIFEGQKFKNKFGLKCKTCDRECFINSHQDKVLSNLPEFQKISENISVLAEARPKDIYDLIFGLKELDHCVAFCSSSCPEVLSLADIGFSMGISGTMMSREASSIIILDDSFYSVMISILWGRHIHEMIKKMAQFQACTICSLVIISIISTFILEKPIFQPIHYLWISFIMNGVAVFLFVFESPSESDLMEKKPVKRDDPLIPKEIKKYIIFQAIYQCAIILALIFSGHYCILEFEDDFDSELLKNNDPLSFKYHFYDDKKFVHSIIDDKNEYIENVYGASRIYTMIFNAFIIMQVFNLFNIRMMGKKQINCFKGMNKSSLAFLFLITLFHAILITFASKLFHVYEWQNSIGFSGLNWLNWLICIGCGLGLLLIRFII